MQAVWLTGNTEGTAFLDCHIFVLAPRATLYSFLDIQSLIVLPQQAAKVVLQFQEWT